MNKITAIITCFNEAHNIVECIQSVSFADEILVVDSYSTDKTVELARTQKCTVVQHEYETPSKQKNWIIPQAKNEWILLLDADERITPELQKEVLEVLKNPQKEAYWIYRTDHFMGKRLRFSGIQGDKVVRLFMRDKCRYNSKYVHEEIDLPPNLKVGYLKQRMLHNTYTTLNAFYEKLNRYADWQAQDYLPKTGHVTFYHLNFKPAFRFFKHYIWGLGILDGFPGYVFAATQSYAVKMRYIKVKQLQKNIP